MSRNRQTRSISRRLLVTSLLAFLIAALVGISARRTAAQTANEVTVSAAISLKDSLDEIGKLYEKAHRARRFPSTMPDREPCNGKSSKARRWIYFFRLLRNKWTTCKRRVSSTPELAGIW